MQPSLNRNIISFIGPIVTQYIERFNMLLIVEFPYRTDTVWSDISNLNVESSELIMEEQTFSKVDINGQPSSNLTSF